MSTLTFHLIGNAHLDPVWLWDWREGLNEGLITTRTILDLMDEFDELTFVRGEASIYQHIEADDPDTFRRIERYVKAGRWDVVGGTLIQPDTNLPATEVFARHFARGQDYFQSRFGRPVRVAWAADSFGHAAGLPEIMAAAGITGFAFTRPFPNALPLAKPAFWWEGPGGSRVLAYRPAVGWYGTDRDETGRRLDACLEAARRCDLQNVGIFHGLGNHGGGPSRRQLLEIRQWAAAHPEVDVVHSGLHRLHDALRREVARRGDDLLPVHRGELNFCLRGCYASVAKFKFAYRKAEAALASAERTDTAIRTALGSAATDLGPAWDDVLFSSFHDILPGSSIERAYDDQLAWLGGAVHTAQRAEMAALNALALKVDTRVARPAGDHPSAVSVLAWNPNPWPYRGHMEWEANMDYRPLKAYKGRGDQVPLSVRDAAGRRLPFQVVENDHTLDNWAEPWRKRVVVPVELPPLGWAMFQYAWEEGAVPPQPRGKVCKGRPGTIDNGIYRVQAAPGQGGVRISRRGKSVFTGQGLSAVVVEDTAGSWGGSDDDPAAINLSRVLEAWPIERVELVEGGPERAALWVRFAGKRSWLELMFQVYRGRDAVDVSARMLWNERYARLKLVMPVGAGDAEFDVPGARIWRAPSGEVPGGRWVRVSGTRGMFGFASDALYAFDCTRGEFRATVVRASGYSNGTPPAMKPWRAAVDCGELKFRFLINPGDAALPALAHTLEQPPVSTLVAPHKGAWRRTGTLAALAPASLQILALKRAEEGRGVVLRVQETSGKATAAELVLLGRRVKLGVVPGGRLATWRLVRTASGWKARATSITER